MKKKGFTLVELLAVIVILAVILVIAVPKITDVITNTKMSSLKSSAQMIVSEAENKYEINKMLGESTSGISCNNLVELNSDDYGSCRVTFDSNGNATVTLNGKENGKFNNMACSGTKSGINCQTGLIDVSTPATCFATEQKISDFTINHDNCVTFFTEVSFYSAESIELICTGEAELEYGYTMEDIAKFEWWNIDVDDLIEEEVIENVEYNDVSITGYDPNCEKDVIIPASIDGYNVVEIGDYAFNLGGYESTGMEISSVIMQEGIEIIGNSAFQGNIITMLTIPDSTKCIRDFAFENNRISSLDLGEGVQGIDYSAFFGNSITRLTIPDSIVVIGDNAFRDNRINSLDLGEGVEEIGRHAFFNNNITKLTIPDSIVVIGDNAFRDNQINELDLGEGVQQIEEGAFTDNQISEIHFPTTPLDIYDNTFSRNPFYDESYTFPSNVNVIPAPVCS